MNTGSWCGESGCKGTDFTWQYFATTLKQASSVVHSLTLTCTLHEVMGQHITKKKKETKFFNKRILNPNQPFLRAFSYIYKNTPGVHPSHTILDQWPTLLWSRQKKHKNDYKPARIKKWSKVVPIKSRILIWSNGHRLDWSGKVHRLRWS